MGLIRVVVVAAALCAALSHTGNLHAQEIHRWVAPKGSEDERTTKDPGWWQRTFVGWDANGDGKYSGGERGILILAYDALTLITVTIAKVLIGVLFSIIPSGWKVDAASLVPYLNTAECWFPITFAANMTVLYYGFLAAYTACRFTLRVVWC